MPNPEEDKEMCIITTAFQPRSDAEILAIKTALTEVVAELIEARVELRTMSRGKRGRNT